MSKIGENQLSLSSFKEEDTLKGLHVYWQEIPSSCNTAQSSPWNRLFYNVVSLISPLSEAVLPSPPTPPPLPCSMPLELRNVMICAEENTQENTPECLTFLSTPELNTGLRRKDLSPPACASMLGNQFPHLARRK